MGHAIYFVVPEGHSVAIDEIGRFIQDSPAVDRIGCVVETSAQRDRLETEGQADYQTIDRAPDLSPTKMLERVRDRSGSSSLNHKRLDRFREEYGEPFLTPFVVSDARYDEVPPQARRALVEVGFEYFETVLKSYSPTVLVTPQIKRPFEWIPARITATDGTYFWWKTTRIGSQYGLIEGSPAEDFCGIRDTFRKIRAGADEATDAATRQAREYISDVRDSGTRPKFYEDRVHSYGSSPTNLLFPRGLPHIRDLASRLITQNEGTERGESGSVRSVRNASRRVRIQLRNPFESPKSGERFVFYPLHAQPEPSTRILAPSYADQAMLARQIATSLPVDCSLYIKDHPRMFRDNTRRPEYYRSLADIPGVQVLRPHEDSHAIIRESAAVLTVTGTPALEAAMFETPSVVLGPTHFDVLSSVRRCRSPEDLPDVLSWALSGDEGDTEEVVAYLTAVFENSFQIETPKDASRAEKQRRIAEAVAPRLLERVGDL